MADDAELLRTIDRKLADLALAHAETRSDVRSIREDLARFKETESDHVTRAEFTPVRAVTYGVISGLGALTIGFLVALITRTP